MNNLPCLISNKKLIESVLIILSQFCFLFQRDNSLLIILQDFVKNFVKFSRICSISSLCFISTKIKYIIIITTYIYLSDVSQSYLQPQRREFSADQGNICIDDNIYNSFHTKCQKPSPCQL